MGLFKRNRVQTPNIPSVSAPTLTDVTKSGTDTGVFQKRVLKALDLVAISTRKSGRDIPTVVYSKIRSIDDVLRPLTDYIVLKGGCSPEQEHLFFGIVERHIPESLQTFMNVNPRDRIPGSEPEKMVVEQFDLMEQKSREFDHLVREGAMDALLAQTYFMDMHLNG